MNLAVPPNIADLLNTYALTGGVGTRCIWLVRHGETPWNADKRFQGHTDIGLNAKGEQQARALGQFLAQLEAQHGQSLFHHCVSSDLQRAHRTALHLLQGLPLGQPPLALSPNLRERHYGLLAGLTGEEMQAQHPVDFAALQARVPHHVLPQGESLQQFYDRVVNAFNTLLQAQPQQHLLLVAHGGVLDCIYRHCTNEPMHTPRRWPLPNAALNVLVQQDGATPTVQIWADQSHLQQGEGPAQDEVDGRVA